METQKLIYEINMAQKVEDVLDIKNFEDGFKTIVKSIHPDICKDPGAPEAMQKMNTWKQWFTKGRVLYDDAGEFTTNGYWAKFQGNTNSIQNYRLLKSLKGRNHENFQKYIPQEGKLQQDGSFLLEFKDRAIPLSELVLPQEHVNWVLNRLLEYCSYLAENGLSHGGINPESIFIVPETHGIQVCSFYHMGSIGKKAKTMSGKYSLWYPKSLRDTKIITPLTDIELSKRTAIYLLGDKSGSGVKLRKTANEKFLNFVLTQHENAYECMTKYRELLKKNFKTQFYQLKI